MPAKKKPPAKKRKPPARAKRSGAKKPHVEQRHWDLIGLGLVTFAVFLGFVLYRGRDGGNLGESAVDGLTWLMGDIAYAVPVALAAIGAILVLRPVLPSVRPFRSGGLCLLAAGLLWLGAENGGKLGELVEENVGRFVGSFGVDVLAIFLFLAAVLLLTGASIAGVVKATSTTVADTTRSLKPVKRPDRPVRVRPPEPVHDEPRVTRIVDDPQEKFPDLFEATVEDEPLPEDPIPPANEEEEAAADGEPSAAEVAAATRAIEIDPDEDLTPQGRYRPHITESADFEWIVPDPDTLTRSSADQAKPDTARQA